MDHMKTAQHNLIKKTEDLRAARSEKQKFQRKNEELESQLQNLYEKHDASEGTKVYYEKKNAEQRDEITKYREENKLLCAAETYYKVEINKYKALLAGAMERNH